MEKPESPMEKKNLEKSSSFAHKEEHQVLDTDEPPMLASSEFDHVKAIASDQTEIKEEEIEKLQEIEEENVDDSVCSLLHLSEEIDQFLSAFCSKEDDHSVKQEIPDFIEKFASLVEVKIAIYDSGEGRAKWRQVAEEDTSFLEDVNRLSKLTTSFGEFKQEPDYASSLNRIGSVLHKSMSFLEEEFRTLLEDSRTFDLHEYHGDSKTKHHDLDHSESKARQDPDRYTLPESEAGSEVNFPGYSDDIVSDLNRIAKAMISGGYETECSEIYIIARRNAFEECLHKIGFEKHSIDDVHKMQWDPLEREIATWIKTFKQSAAVLFPGEKKLAESVFSEIPSKPTSIFTSLARGFVIQLLNFAEGVAMSKRSTEKLFKFLDIYETLRDTASNLEALFSNECAAELKAEISTARGRIGEYSISIFGELENSIRSDSSKTPVPGGAVHPLTRYTMNYLGLACGYKDTLEQVFKEHQRIERADSTSGSDYELPSHVTPEMLREAPFSVQLMRVMDLLDTNLEGKSKLYKDLALSNIFLMNNGRYMLQKIKAAKEIHELIGDTWSRKRSSDLRQYHKNYQRETWSKVLGCLSHEGVNVNGKVVKPALKERFKSFSTMFDEIHKTQSTWVVSDEQLQSELRVSISAVCIPAYRSFHSKFSQYLTPGRQTEKYIKYQPEDIETYIEDLFDGNPNTFMGRKRP